MKTVAIMQPTFLPWIGYFALIDRVDEFIFLDNVAFDHRSWQQRNQIKTPSGAAWLSVPVQTKGQSGQLIKDVAIQYESGNPFDKIAKTIHHNYSKTPFYAKYAPPLMEIFARKPQNLKDLNIGIIEVFCGFIGIRKNFYESSAMKAQGTKADLLAEICEERGASAYISPPGSKAYLDASDAFKEKGIPVLYHEYNHPPYSQLYGDFLPYMSIIDLLFNEGERSAHILKSGVKQ